MFIGHFLYTFENGIGNINNPTFSFAAGLSKMNGLDYTLIGLVYILWFVAQIILLVILLNFVIALISQYYEDVMSS